MKFSFSLKTETPQSFRKNSIISAFDLKNEQTTEEFTGEIPIESTDWGIGVIVGPSGTGKTSIAKKLFGEKIISEFSWTDSCIVDDMPKNKTIKEITKTFNSVGFSSPPSWLKPFHVLSNGEKMRVLLARALLSDLDFFAFDEFTSVVDRNVARIGSFAMQKAIRSQKKKFIAISCHYDILEWLEPDWVFDTKNMVFFWENTNDQTLNYQYTRQKKKIGTFLGNIII